MLNRLQAWAEAGLLRHLDVALAGLVARLDPQASPRLLLLTALLAQMESRGHTCLTLADWAGDGAQALLGWPAMAAGEMAELVACLASDRLERPPGEPLAGPTDGSPDWAVSPALRLLRLQDGALHGAPDVGQPLVLLRASAAGGGNRLFLRRYWDHEREVARHVRARLDSADRTPDAAAIRRWLDRLFPEPPGAEPDWQKLACALALSGRLTLITGGPGTGKTYTAARLLALLLATAAEPERLRVALAAPTGKAAARLKQAIDIALVELVPQLQPAVADAGQADEPVPDLARLAARIGAARTLHALLGARPDTRAFARHAGSPLDLDVLIVDEASMIHLEMMAALLAALPAGARLILLGDKDQLASVEAGAVLGELCQGAEVGRYSPATARLAADWAGVDLPAMVLEPESSAPALAQHTVMLRRSRRFGGPIGALALAVNEGRAIDAEALLAAPSAGVLQAWPAATPALAWELALHGRPGAEGGYGRYLAEIGQGPPRAADPSGDEARADHASWVHRVLDAFERFRLLCAVREGEWGAQGLNRAVQTALAGAGWLRPTGTWFVGRPVMVTRNDAALGVFNGDIGMTLPGVTGPGLRVWFRDGAQLRSVGVARLTQVETAFAMTVHKSQGSEFEHTVLVLPDQAGGVLSRELVYTGITRARKAFSLVSARPGALAAAIAQPTRRESGLMGLLNLGEDPSWGAEATPNSPGLVSAPRLGTIEG